MRCIESSAQTMARTERFGPAHRLLPAIARRHAQDDGQFNSAPTNLADDTQDSIAQARASDPSAFEALCGKTSWNWAASVEPASAVVDEWPPETTWAISSK